MVIFTGDGSAYQVAQKQPMKLAAMEGLYQGKSQAGLVAIGILNPKKISLMTRNLIISKLKFLICYLFSAIEILTPLYLV